MTGLRVCSLPGAFVADGKPGVSAKSSFHVTSPLSLITSHGSKRLTLSGNV